MHAKWCRKSVGPPLLDHAQHRIRHECLSEDELQAFGRHISYWQSCLWWFQQHVWRVKDYIDVKARSISGFSEGLGYRPGDKLAVKPLSHEWNAVVVNGKEEIYLINMGTGIWYCGFQSGKKIWSFLVLYSARNVRTETFSSLVWAKFVQIQCKVLKFILKHKM